MQSPSDDDPEDAIDILLLGGSVFHEDFSTVPSVLQHRLEARTGRPIRIRNLARATQEILDWENPDLLPLPTERVVAPHARYNDAVREVAGACIVPAMLFW